MGSMGGVPLGLMLAAVDLEPSDSNSVQEVPEAPAAPEPAADPSPPAPPPPLPHYPLDPTLRRRTTPRTVEEQARLREWKRKAREAQRQADRHAARRQPAAASSAAQQGCERREQAGHSESEWSLSCVTVESGDEDATAAAGSQQLHGRKRGRAAGNGGAPGGRRAARMRGSVAAASAPAPAAAGSPRRVVLLPNPRVAAEMRAQQRRPQQKAKTAARSAPQAQEETPDMAGAQQVSQSWMSRLLTPGTIVWCGKLSRHADNVFFSLGADSCAALLWPAECIVYGTTRAWRPRQVKHFAELPFVCCTDVKQYTVLPAQARSPAHFWSKAGKKWLQNGIPQSFLVQTATRPIDLLTYHAERAFVGVDSDVLNRVLRDVLHAEFDPSAGLPERLHLAIKAILKCTDERALEILETRDMNVQLLAEGCMEYLETEEAMGAMSHGDQKETEAVLEQARRQRDLRKSFHEHLRTYREEAESKAKKRKTCAFPGDAELELDVELLSKWLPHAGCRLFRDPFNGRWRGWYRLGRDSFSASKSWGPHAAEARCVRHVIARLWAHHTEVTGQQCPYTGLVS